MIKPYTSEELRINAIEAKPLEPERVVATYADPDNWLQVTQDKRNYWAWIGPVIVGYELGQWCEKDKPKREAEKLGSLIMKSQENTK